MLTFPRWHRSRMNIRLLRYLERRRLRHPHPDRSQGGINKAARTSGYCTTSVTTVVRVAFPDTALTVTE
jgi:hypothetical protein